MVDAPVNVRLIKTDLLEKDSLGNYVAPEEEPDITKKADLIYREQLHLGLLFQSSNAIEKLARQDAFEKESDIVVIRPNVTPKKGVALQVIMEFWRTKGYQQLILDDIPEPGTTLLPPPNTS